MKLAIIGFGGRITDVLNNVLKIAGERMTVVGWADEQPAPSGLTRFPQAGQGFVDHREMLKILRPDAVMIGSPNHLHLAHIRNSLAAGCKVFSEKPVVITPEESWEVAELLKQYGQERLIVGLVLRCAPLYRATMAAITDGKIGRPITMEANEILGPQHGAFIATDWRRKREFSGSHILEKCCHDIDLIQALLGGRLTKIASFGGRSIFTPENRALASAGNYGDWGHGWPKQQNLDPFADDSDITDHQVTCAEVEGGAKLTFNLNNHGAWGQRRWLICGTKGTWESDLGNGRSRYQGVFGTAEISAPADAGGGHYGADDQMAKDLVATWLHGVEFPVPTRAAIEAGLAAMGIDQAQREGRIVDLTPWWAKLDAILGAGAAKAPVSSFEA